jgi:uncharacterized protein (DUF58 family)
MSLTRKPLGYLAIAYAFIFLSLAFRASWLAVFVLPIAVLLFASLGPLQVDPFPLSITRQMRPSRSLGGEDVTIILTVKNNSPHFLHSLVVQDKLPDALKLGGGTNRMVLSLRSGESTSFEYQISKPRRGSYEIGPTVVRFSGNLGLRTAAVQLSNIDELIVLPQIERLGVVDLKGKRFGPWPGLVPSRRIGIGTEFFEIAPYVPGVDLRRVNWKASARYGTLVTNEFEGEQVIDVLVVLDCSEALSSELFDYDALEFQVNFAASLCSQLIMQGNRVGLTVYGAVRTWLSPGFGKRHLLRLLDGLAVVKPGPATLPIRYVVESVVSAILPTRSLVILISPLFRDEVADMIEGVAMKGYKLVCFTPSIRADLGGTSESSKIARRILAGERKLRIMRVKRMSDLIQLSPELPIKPLLRMRGRWNQA